MKKTIIASSLAVALGVTGVAGSVGGHDAHAAQQTQFKYTVKSGDTLSKIGEKFNVSVEQLKQWNGLHSDLIIVDQKLTIYGQAQAQQVQNYNNVQYSQNAQPQYNNQVTQSTQSTQATQATQSTQAYNQSQKVQQAPQQGSQSTQHAEQVRTQQAPKSTQAQAPKQTQVTNYQAPKQVTSNTTQSSSSGGSVRLSNGNTAGATGSSAAQEMAKRTGVPASTWEHIIARESNGDPNARNASGASGLLQTMPAWGSTATVQDQINAATKAYKAQGLSAWGM